MRFLFVLGLICFPLCTWIIFTAMAEDNKCECSTAEMAACAAVGAVASVGTVTFAITAAGFTATGIAASSLGSWLMSVMAPVSPGGLVAILQSIGVLGLSTAGKVVTAASGGSVLAAACKKMKCG